MDRKCLFFGVICLLVVLLVLPVSAFAADASVCGDAGHAYDNGFCTACDDYQAATGSGTAEQPYEISNAGQLYWFAKQVNDGNTDIWGVLTADIVINTQVLTEDGALNGDGSGFWQWVPIGGDVAYKGTFDGNGKTISGIYFSGPASYAGLFGRTGVEAVVKGVVIRDQYIDLDHYTDQVDSYSYTGGVVGDNAGAVENCYNTGTVSGSSSASSYNTCYSYSYTGGVVGRNTGAVVDCYNTGAVSGSSNASYSEKSYGTYSYGYSYSGGVVGHNTGAVVDCYNTGIVSGSSSASRIGTNTRDYSYSYVGGVVGYNYDGTVENCYSTGAVSCGSSDSYDSYSYTGGVVGHNTGAVADCYNTGVVSASFSDFECCRDAHSHTGGVVGENYYGTVSNCYNTGDVSGSFYEFVTDNNTGGVVGYNYDGTVENCYNTGAVRGSITVSTRSSYSYTGGVVGYNYNGTVENCYNIGAVSGSSRVSDSSSCSYTGGVVGYNYDGAVKKCYNTGAVRGSSSASCGDNGSLCNTGGVVGYNWDGTVENCYNTGVVDGIASADGAARSHTGGVVGENYEGTVGKCYNIGNVSGSSSASSESSKSYSYTGGVVGYNNYDGTVENCYNASEVNGSAVSDGEYSESYSYTGGVVGYNDISIVTNCYYDSQFFRGNAIGFDSSPYESGNVWKVGGKNTAQFESGEVAYLLGTPFGQNIDNGQDNEGRPMFSDAIVYEFVDCLGNSGYSNYDGDGHRYRSSDGTCALCGKECVHNFKERVVAPTCTEQGYTQHICSGCGYSYSTDYVEALGNHSYQSEVTEPTCTEVGFTTYTCTTCGDSYVADETAALGHSWVDATCTEAKTCSVCGETEGEALGHDYEAVVTAPTCTEGGYTTYTCTVCGDSYVVDTAALGHSWVEATCTEAKACSVCGETEGEALGHDYASVVTAPTCTEAGFTTYTCTVCGDSYVAGETAALGHSGVDATCTAPKTCSVCGETEGEALGHSYETVVTDPTCTESGHTTYTCTVCGDSYVGDEATALGHDWVDATCIAPRTCSRCGSTTGTVSDHRWNDATCTDPKTCAVCGITSGSAMGHNWKAATCTEPRVCASCGATSGSPLDHRWRPADCEHPRMCEYCDATEGEVLGHDFLVTTGICTQCGEAAPFEVEAPQMERCYTKEHTYVRSHWTKVEGVDGYELYRSTDPDDLSSFELVKTIYDPDVTTYVNQGLTKGVTYYYRVCSIVFLEDGVTRVRSALSNVKHIPAMVVWDAPYSNSDFRVRLRWNEVSGCHGYQIWIREEGGQYRVVKTIGDKGNTLTKDQGGVTAYSNVGLKAGQKYTYKMRAFYIDENGTKTYGPYSDEVTVAVQPSAPVISVNSYSVGRVKVMWELPCAADGHQIWMSEKPDSGFGIVKSVTDGSATSYTKNGLQSGKTYYFKVRSYTEVNGKKSFGAYSETIMVTIK